LLKAMSQVIKKFPQIELILVGDGPDKQFFFDLIKKLGIVSNVKFTGNVTKNKILQFYSNSTIVVVPSIYPDNFPTVCIEAMSVGRPLIGTRMGGIQELIDDGETGYLVSPKNEYTIADTIIKLLSNKSLLNRFSSNSIKKSTKYSLEEHIKKIEKLYKKYGKEI
ncbi:MAG TPA: glycosyltransferase family 4 protein, partial [Candidatus Woesebacteria bacterium]|nr:glycosyltransferase family 4 protein [Candidatus Woesebacteria bacterium]